MVIRTTSPQETQAFGKQLTTDRSGPLCIALRGDLGAGKTTLVRGLLAGWGGDVNQVSSPTYVLLNCYQSPRGPVYHLDAYRVHGADDFEAIGFSELIDQPAMVIVEWPQRVESLLPRTTLWIDLKAVETDVRQIEVRSLEAKKC